MPFECVWIAYDLGMVVDGVRLPRRAPRIFRELLSSHARAPDPMGSYETGTTCNWLAQHVGAKSGSLA